MYTCWTDSKKKNIGSRKTANKHEITKNLFHCWTTFAWGFITGGIYRRKKEAVLFAQPFASPYIMLWNWQNQDYENKFINLT